MRFLVSLFSAIVLTAVLSLIFELTPTGADKSFLALLITAVLAALVGNILYSRYDKTNGNDSGLVAAALLVMGDGIVCILVPLLILFGVLPYALGTICAAAAIVVWTGFLTFGLIH